MTIHIDQTALLAWLKPTAVLIAALVVGWLCKTVLLRQIEKWTKNTDTPLDDVIVGMLRKYAVFWFGLLGLVMASKLAPISDTWIKWIGMGVLVLFGLSVSWAAAGVASVALNHYGKKVSLDVSALSLTQNLLRIMVVGLGVLIILSNLGISIAPLLTALGVGSLAVALALQDTLSNLFAGFYIIISRYIHVGDYIQLDSGQEGYVTDISWRACTIRQLSGNMIIVPNQKLSQTIVVNYNKPTKDLAVLVNVGVSYTSDLKLVEKVTIEVAKEIMQEVTGGVPDFEPFIRYNGFGDSSINFTVILRGKEFVDRYLIMHEFIKRLQARYLVEKIEIPFPQRVVHLVKSE